MQVKGYDKASGIYVDQAPRLSFEEFTAELIHGIRNSLHGYRMMGRTYERFLAIHSGEVSNRLPDLGTVFLFAFLSDPAEFMKHTWSKHLSQQRHRLNSGRRMPGGWGLGSLRGNGGTNRAKEAVLLVR